MFGGMGDPGGTCGPAGVTEGGTGGEPGPAAGGGEPARKAGGATKGRAGSGGGDATRIEPGLPGWATMSDPGRMKVGCIDIRCGTCG